MPCLNFLKSRIPPGTPLAIVVLAVLILAGGKGANATTLQGQVVGQNVGLPGYGVTLYASYVGDHPVYVPIAYSRTNDSGDFTLKYGLLPEWLAPGLKPVLFVIAQKGQITLASAIGVGSNALSNVVVNERTTVATGNAFAQFIHEGKIEGNTYGMINAVRMAANLANPQTGEVGVILSSLPNGPETPNGGTSTYATFNSLTNVVASCIADAGNCRKLLQAATPRGGPKPFERITGAQIDPSGNIWITNNWKRKVNPIRNPGGNAMVVAIGVAGPLKTPLIGPPVPFE